MRNVILQEFVTLEGFAAGPNGSLDFVPAATKDDRSFGREQLALMEDVDTILLGRVIYQMFSGYWPGTSRTFRISQSTDVLARGPQSRRRPSRASARRAASSTESTRVPRRRCRT